jgi:SOS-response transcriptional repressor LexA
MNQDWVDRLNRWLAESGWSVAEYSRRAGISVDSIHKYLDREVAQPRGDRMARLAAPFGKTEIQLRYGLDNITAGEAQIPLLTANEVGTLDPANKNMAREGRSVSVLSSEVGPNWFGVIVPDNACAPKIVKGAIAYCDPDSQVAPGDYVIAKVPGVDVGVCRRYRKTDGLDPTRFELQPEDDDFPAFVSTPESPIQVWPIVKVLSDPPRS